MKVIYFVSDYFIPEATGGAEKCNDALISEFFNEKYNDFENYILVTITSNKLTPEIMEKNPESTFFIANFMRLSEESKEALMQKNIDYIIIEHDHKYLKNNNPALYDNFLADEEGIQNVAFYKKARAVLCQSGFASSILHRNIELENLINLDGNLWSEADLGLLQELSLNSKSPEARSVRWGILKTDNPNKGFPEAVSYCHSNKVPYTYIGSPSFSQFMTQVADCEGIVLLPRWVETFNRYLIEARALNCKVMTNKKVGCVQDGWMEFKGEKMIQKMRSTKQRIFKVYDKLVNKEKVEYFKPSLPRVTIITTFVEAEEFIEEYIEAITKQTIFEEIDLLIYDAGSSGEESEIISRYSEKFSNIKHIRDEERITSSEAFNRMIQASDNDYIGMVMIDDRPAPWYAEKLRKYLHFSEVDLVYGDCVQTYESNSQIGESFYTSSNLYEHSKKEFSKENMIKSLPGPMPMFRKSMIENNGGFNSDFKHANDWELWLRCVRAGSKFRKVHNRVGLYYFNPAGVTTSAEKFSSKIKEEASLFMEYKDVIGEENFNKYKQYFSQGLAKK